MFGALEDFIKEKANVFGPPPAITRQVVQRALALVVSPDINPLFFGLEQQTSSSNQLPSSTVDREEEARRTAAGFSQTSLKIFEKALHQQQSDDSGQTGSKNAHSTQHTPSQKVQELDAYFAQAEGEDADQEVLRLEFQRLPRYIDLNEINARVEYLEGHSVEVGARLSRNMLRHYDTLAQGCANIDIIDARMNAALLGVRTQRAILSAAKREYHDKIQRILQAQRTESNMRNTHTLLHRLRTKYANLLTCQQMLRARSNALNHQGVQAYLWDTRAMLDALARYDESCRSEKQLQQQQKPSQQQQSPPEEQNLACVAHAQQFSEHLKRELSDAVREDCKRAFTQKSTEKTLLHALHSYGCVQADLGEYIQDFEQFYQKILGEESRERIKTVYQKFLAPQQMIAIVNGNSNGHTQVLPKNGNTSTQAVTEPLNLSKKIILSDFLQFVKDLYSACVELLFNNSQASRQLLLSQQQGTTEQQNDFIKHCKTIVQRNQDFLWNCMQEVLVQELEPAPHFQELTTMQMRQFIVLSSRLLRVGDELQSVCATNKSFKDFVLRKCEKNFSTFLQQQLTNLLNCIANDEWKRVPFKTSYKQEALYKQLEKVRTLETQEYFSEILILNKDYQRENLENLTLEQVMERQSLLQSSAVEDIFALLELADTTDTKRPAFKNKSQGKQNGHNTVVPAMLETDQDAVLSTSSHKLLKLFEICAELCITMRPIAVTIFKHGIIHSLELFLYFVLTRFLSPAGKKRLLDPLTVQELNKPIEEGDLQMHLLSYMGDCVRLRREYEELRTFYIRNSYRLDKCFKDLSIDISPPTPAAQQASPTHLQAQLHSQGAVNVPTPQQDAENHLTALVVVCESFRFVVQNLQLLISPLLQECTTDAETRTRVRSAIELQRLLSAKLTDLLYGLHIQESKKAEQIIAAVSLQKWELREADLQPVSAHLDRLKNFLHDELERLPSLDGGVLTISSQQAIFAKTVHNTVRLFVDQVALIRKLNTVGRQQLERDLCDLATFVQTLHRQEAVLKNVPAEPLLLFIQEYAMAYVAATQQENFAEVLKTVQQGMDKYSLKVLVALLSISIAGSRLYKNQLKEHYAGVLQEY